MIGICYLAELYFAHPPLGTVALHSVKPEFAGSESVLLAVGILGATVMPHVIYLHSALTQNRVVPRNDSEARRLYHYTKIDVVIAMSIAGLINMAMLVVAATVFYGHGIFDVASLETAHKTLEPILGSASSTLFALALLASGLSSSTVGTLSGQVVMRDSSTGRSRSSCAGCDDAAGAGRGRDRAQPVALLVLSQVVLSFGIPFALIPLVWFTSRRELMGTLVNRRATTAVAACVAALISGLNLFLLGQTFNLF